MWTYFLNSTENSEEMLGSWAGCLRDEAEESERKGYSQEDVGVWSRFSIRGEKERIFYVPSAECSLAGEEFVKIILEIIISEEDQPESQRNNKFAKNYQLYCREDQRKTTVTTPVSLLQLQLLEARLLVVIPQLIQCCLFL